MAFQRFFGSESDRSCTYSDESGWGVAKVPDSKAEGLVGNQQGFSWHPKKSESDFGNSWAFFGKDRITCTWEGNCKDSGYVGGFEIGYDGEPGKDDKGGKGDNWGGKDDKGGMVDRGYGTTGIYEVKEDG